MFNIVFIRKGGGPYVLDEVHEASQSTDFDFTLIKRSTW